MALTDKLTAIADAIRAKDGTIDLLTLDGMVEAINAIETSSGSPDVTNSIVSVAFSATDASGVFVGFSEIVPEDAKIAIFNFQGDLSNAPNNNCLLAILPKAYINNQMSYCRKRDGAYQLLTNSANTYDLIVNAGDTFRMVVLH